MVRKILFVALIVVLIDQVTKLLAERFFNVVENTGAAYGLLEGWRLLFVGVALLVIYLIFHYRKEMDNLGLGLLLGGTIGNLIDRLFFSYVADFIFIGRITGWFNVADAANLVGVAIIILKSMKKK